MENKNNNEERKFWLKEEDNKVIFSFDLDDLKGKSEEEKIIIIDTFYNNVTQVFNGVKEIIKGNYKIEDNNIFESKEEIKEVDEYIRRYMDQEVKGPDSTIAAVYGRPGGMAAAGLGKYPPRDNYIYDFPRVDIKKKDDYKIEDTYNELPKKPTR